MLVDMGISDVELYRVALTAPSAVSTGQIVASCFDRLEFLGDSVVGLVFRSWVYNRLAGRLTCSFHKVSSSFPAGLPAPMSCLRVIICCYMASVLEQTWILP